MGIHRKYSGTLTRAAATVSGTEQVTGVGIKPVMVLFNAMDDADTNTFSKGWDDGTVRSSVLSQPVTVLLNLLGTTGNVTVCQQSHTNALHVQTGANGHSAALQSLDQDGFTLNWTRIGTGRNITVKYLAIV